VALREGQDALGGVEVQERRNGLLDCSPGLIELIDPMAHETGKSGGGGSKPTRFLGWVRIKKL